MISVLNCSPDKELQQLRAKILALRHCIVVCPRTPDHAIREMQRGHFDVLLLCSRLRKGRVMDRLCREFRAHFNEGKVIVVEHERMELTEPGADEIVSAYDPDAMVTAVLGRPFLVKSDRRAA